jgi:hypothetical protein
MLEKLAPLGWEDAAGFHFGEATTVHWKPRRGFVLMVDTPRCPKRQRLRRGLSQPPELCSNARSWLLRAR